MRRAKSSCFVPRVREATAEIQKVARKDSALAAAGAVLFLEEVSPALEQVDSSSSAIGTAVNHAIEACAGIIAEAPVDDQTRDQWLDAAPKDSLDGVWRIIGMAMPDRTPAFAAGPDG